MAHELPLFAEERWQPKPKRIPKEAPKWTPGIFDIGILRVIRHPTTEDDDYGYATWSVFFHNGARFWFHPVFGAKRIWGPLV